MKIYSSTFLSLILAFFIFLSSKGQEIIVVKDADRPVYSNIQEPTDFGGYGPKTDKVTIEVFNGFDCTDCRDFNFDTLPILMEKYAGSEDVNFSFYTVPNSDDRDQYDALIGVKCAEDQGKYLEMYNELQLNKVSKREADLTAQGIGLDLMPYRACVKSGKHEDEIQTVIDYAAEKGVEKKPTILIGDYVLTGNQPIENIERIIKALSSKL